MWSFVHDVSNTLGGKNGMQKHLARALAISFLLFGLGVDQSPGKLKAKPVSGNSTTTKPEIVNQSDKQLAYQIGTASWYGDNFDGKRTASGDTYDKYDLSAAHLTIQLGTYVKVTNLLNGRAVVVKVNDRGPMAAGRIIDLSYGAARALHFWHGGLVPVRIDLIELPHTKTDYQTLADNHVPVESSP
jgi:rare lipoprotein A (peptidoglycan hydrolase)